MKKLLLPTLAILLVLLLVGCDYPKSITDSPQATPMTHPAVATKTPAPAIRVDKVIYDEGNIKVSVAYTSGEGKVVITISNAKSEDIYYEITGVSVNRCMVYDMIPMSTVAAGKTAIVNYSLYGARDYGIGTVEELGFGIQFNDSEFRLNKTVIQSVAVTESQTLQYSPPGYCFYDDDDCSAYFVAPDNKFKSFEAVYYNKTGKNLSAYMTDVSVNGIMIDQTPLFGYFYILPNCYAFTGTSDGSIVFYSALDNEIESKGLETVNSLAGKLEIWGTKEYHTDEIQIYPQQ